MSKDKLKVGEVATQAILDGATNEEALAAVLKAVPGAQTTLPSINWYRNAARKENKRVPTERDVKKDRGIVTPRAASTKKAAPAKKAAPRKAAAKPTAKKAKAAGKNAAATAKKLGGAFAGAAKGKFSFGAKK